jgi:hypothetical protein
MDSFIYLNRILLFHYSNMRTQGDATTSSSISQFKHGTSSSNTGPSSREDETTSNCSSLFEHATSSSNMGPSSQEDDTMSSSSKLSSF